MNIDNSGLGFQLPEAIDLPPAPDREMPAAPPRPFALHDGGRITCAGTTHPEQEMLAKPGFLFLDQEATMAGHWIDLSGPTPRLALRPALDLPTTATLAVGQTLALTLPYDGQVSVDDVVSSFTAGEVPFMAEWPGTYRLSIDAWPAKPHVLVVEVTS